MPVRHHEEMAQIPEVMLLLEAGQSSLSCEHGTALPWCGAGWQHLAPTSLRSFTPWHTAAVMRNCSSATSMVMLTSRCDPPSLPTLWEDI